MASIKDRIVTSTNNVTTGKNLISQVITSKGVPTSSSDSFKTMKDNIEKLEVVSNNSKWPYCKLDITVYKNSEYGSEKEYIGKIYKTVYFESLYDRGPIYANSSESTYIAESEYIRLDYIVRESYPEIGWSEDGYIYTAEVKFLFNFYIHYHISGTPRFSRSSYYYYGDDPKGYDSESKTYDITSSNNISSFSKTFYLFNRGYDILVLYPGCMIRIPENKISTTNEFNIQTTRILTEGGSVN